MREIFNKIWYKVKKALFISLFLFKETTIDPACFYGFGEGEQKMIIGENCV